MSMSGSTARTPRSLKCSFIMPESISRSPRYSQTVSESALLGLRCDFSLYVSAFVERRWSLAISKSVFTILRSRCFPTFPSPLPET